MMLMNQGLVVALLLVVARKTTSLLNLALPKQAFKSCRSLKILECHKKLASKSKTPEEKYRGDRYNDPSSTVPTTDKVAAFVGVRPPDKAPPKAWKRAWVSHKRSLPLLHLFDRMKPPNSSKALICLWLKALSGNDVNSPVFDHGLAYDLLPRGTRFLVSKRFVRFYPRFHHANIEIRTAYLDQAIQRIIEQQRSTDGERRVRLVSLGAGYDTRSVRLQESKWVDEAWELDLPTVVEAKTVIFRSKRFRRRQPNATLPTFIPVDLNQLQEVEQVLKDIIVSVDTSRPSMHTIFLFEGVMIYLNEGVPCRLLQVCRSVLQSSDTSGSLVFADRLEQIPGGDMEIGTRELASAGWKLVEWQPKPGLARHMGRAEHA